MKIIFWSCVSVWQCVCSQRVLMWPLPWCHWSVTGHMGPLWTYSNLFPWWDPGSLHLGEGVTIQGRGSAYSGEEGVCKRWAGWAGTSNAGGKHPTGMLPCYVRWSHLVEFPLLNFYFWCYSCSTSACLYVECGTHSPDSLVAEHVLLRDVAQ